MGGSRGDKGRIMEDWGFGGVGWRGERGGERRRRKEEWRGRAEGLRGRRYLKRKEFSVSFGFSGPVHAEIDQDEK